MSGVRLHHPTLHSVTFVVEQIDRPYHRPVSCYPCSLAAGKEIVHHVKTYHLELDSSGDVIVSETVAEQLKKIPTMAGLEIANEVKKPPTIHLSMGNGKKTKRFSLVKHKE